MAGDVMDSLHVKELYTGLYTASAIGTVSASGYITVKDESGNDRKVLVR